MPLLWYVCHRMRNVIRSLREDVQVFRIHTFMRFASALPSAEEHTFAKKRFNLQGRGRTKRPSEKLLLLH